MEKKNIVFKPNIGKRILATLIDYSLTIIFIVFYLRIFGDYSLEENTYSTSGLKSIPLLAFWFIFHVLIEYTTGRTFGHYILNLRVLTLNGNKTNLIQNLKRHLVDPFEFIPFALPALISIKTTEKNQRIGDLWAKTIVVNNDFRLIRNFYLRSKEEQNDILGKIECDKCNKVNPIENISEYEQLGKTYISGYCIKCGRKLINEI